MEVKAERLFLKLIFVDAYPESSTTKVTLVLLIPYHLARLTSPMGLTYLGKKSDRYYLYVINYTHNARILQGWPPFDAYPFGLE